MPHSHRSSTFPFVRLLIFVFGLFLLTVVFSHLTAEFFEQRAAVTSDTLNYLDQSLKPGMSREEVYEVFGKVSAYTIQPLPFTVCGLESLKLKVERIVVTTRWQYPEQFGVFVCFDQSGKLVHHQMHDD